MAVPAENIYHIPAFVYQSQTCGDLKTGFSDIYDLLFYGADEQIEVLRKLLLPDEKGAFRDMSRYEKWEAFCRMSPLMREFPLTELSQEIVCRLTGILDGAYWTYPDKIWRIASAAICGYPDSVHFAKPDGEVPGGIGHTTAPGTDTRRGDMPGDRFTPENLPAFCGGNTVRYINPADGLPETDDLSVWTRKIQNYLDSGADRIVLTVPDDYSFVRPDPYHVSLSLKKKMREPDSLSPCEQDMIFTQVARVTAQYAKDTDKKTVFLTHGTGGREVALAEYLFDCAGGIEITFCGDKPCMGRAVTFGRRFAHVGLWLDKPHGHAYLERLISEWSEELPVAGLAGIHLTASAPYACGMIPIFNRTVNRFATE